MGGIRKDAHSLTRDGNRRELGAEEHKRFARSFCFRTSLQAASFGRDFRRHWQAPLKLLDQWGTTVRTRPNVFGSRRTASGDPALRFRSTLNKAAGHACDRCVIAHATTTAPGMRDLPLPGQQIEGILLSVTMLGILPRMRLHWSRTAY